MPKSILASLTGLSTDRSVLETAIAAARIEGGHVLGVYGRVDAEETASVIKVGLPRLPETMPDMIRRLTEEEAARSRHAHAAFADAIRGGNIPLQERPRDAVPVSASWKEIDSFSDGLVDEARYHDMVVLAKGDELSSERVKSLLMQAGRPLLLAPPKPVAAMGRTIAIAWKEGAEAARAVTAAAPLLAKAQRVFVFTVARDRTADDIHRLAAEKLANQLSWQGVKVEVGVEYAPARPESHALLDMVYGSEADLLVMGAYGHSRLREYVFGGVTEDMLGGCAVPVFMFR
jgi:nucleotide-binding universal stress UspA family protein